MYRVLALQRVSNHVGGRWRESDSGEIVSKLTKSVVPL